MLRPLYMLVLALVMTLGIASSAAAVTAETALRADREFSTSRVGRFASNHSECISKSALGTVKSRPIPPLSQGEQSQPDIMSVQSAAEAVQQRILSDLGQRTADALMDVADALEGPTEYDGIPIRRGEIPHPGGGWTRATTRAGPAVGRSLSAAADITTRSMIGRSSYATRLAQGLSQQAQRDVDKLLSAVRAGNTNPGIGTRALGNGFFELRGANAGRVIIKQTSNNAFDIVGKFQGHVRGDVANSAIIQRLMSDYLAF
jgi:hypothetical protein